eukprot:TRINITY_DN534_c0_g1_i1.p1 TRINITY_DN534_c0_g1~~TRINITY_DN534_c0_g1_i1.p1  ORF type:complete len:113 (-),score=11.50 TRINITY_DN534_c0_g1_i1:106-444(-)
MTSAAILNLNRNPFDDETEEFGSSKTTNYIHIRIQQRNGRKTLTTVQGLSTELDFHRILKAFKRGFHCNGTIVDDPELGKIIQLQGDHRKEISKFLITEGIVDKNIVKVHGF